MTAAFLETLDLIKLLQLSKEYRREMLGSNATVYVALVYGGHITRLQGRLTEWTDRNSELTK